MIASLQATACLTRSRRPRLAAVRPSSSQETMLLLAMAFDEVRFDLHKRHISDHRCHADGMAMASKCIYDVKSYHEDIARISQPHPKPLPAWKFAVICSLAYSSRCLPNCQIEQLRRGLSTQPDPVPTPWTAVPSLQAEIIASSVRLPSKRPDQAWIAVKVRLRNRCSSAGFPRRRRPRIYKRGLGV